MTYGLVNASFSLPEWRAVKMIFFAPCHCREVETRVNVWTVRQKNGCCREVAFSGGVMPKIVKTQNNTHTTIEKGTNDGFPNTKKPHTELEFNGYRYYFSKVSHHNFISSTPAQI